LGLCLCLGSAFLACWFSFRPSYTTPATRLGAGKARASLARGFHADVNEALIFLFLRKALLTPCPFRCSTAIFHVTAAAPGANGSFAPRLSAHRAACVSLLLHCSAGWRLRPKCTECICFKSPDGC